MTQASIRRRLERLDSGEAVGTGHAYVIQLAEGQNKEAALRELGIRLTDDDAVVFLTSYNSAQAVLVKTYRIAGACWLPLEE